MKHIIKEFCRRRTLKAKFCLLNTTVDKIKCCSSRCLFFPFQLSFQIVRKHRYRRHFDIDDWLFSLHLLFWYRTETARTFGVESVSVSYRHPNRNVRGFLVCVSIMKREGNMASMPFLFDTWSGSLQWHRMIFFFLF